MQKWVSVWGNAVSIAENRPERYAKEITLRYPIVLPFSGSGVRLTFDNYCGTEPVTLEKVTIFCGGAFHPVTFGGERRVTLPAEGNAISDTLETPVTAGEKLLVSFYLRDFTLCAASCSPAVRCPAGCTPTATKRRTSIFRWTHPARRS